MKKHLYLYFLILLSSVFTSFTLNAQAEVSPCLTDPPIFTGTPESTLCDELGGLVYTTVLGGTITRTSNYRGSVSGNVHIIGDFTIDSDFAFRDCNVKIDPGVTIRIQNFQDPSLAKLRIENSKLFACNDLWEGILMGSKSTIFTLSSTIEDAETAILATQESSLFIRYTTFNRNRRGLDLRSSVSYLNTPVVYNLLVNRFTCDAPLNGTTDEITAVGIRLKNTSIFTLSGSIGNHFEDLIVGIESSGLSNLYCNDCEFENIKIDGIIQDGGYLDVRNSHFTNCNNGIQIRDTRTSRISNSVFVYNDDLDPTQNVGVASRAIEASKFQRGSKLHVFGSTFNAIRSTSDRRIQGIFLRGGNVGENTEILIGDNQFDFQLEDGNCIEMDGFFPNFSRTQIFDNDIVFEPLIDLSPEAALFFTGEKNNLRIYNNRFEMLEDLGYGGAIHLNGSSGINNEVTDNTFLIYYPLLLDIGDGYTSGIHLENFQNTIVCQNSIANANTCAKFVGNNDGTQLSLNTFIGGGASLLLDNGVIGGQEQMGNRWFHKWRFVFPDQHALCTPEDRAKESLFKVHTDQSMELPLPPYYSFFSEYHPARIDPLFADANEKWFEKKPGTPLSACATRAPKEEIDPGLDHLIAHNQLSYQSDPIMSWSSQRYLYQKLKLYPALVNEDPVFASFMAANQHTPIGKFYELADQMAAAMQTDSSEMVQLISGITEKEGLIDSMLYLMEALDTSSSSSQAEALMLDIVQLNTEMMTLDSVLQGSENAHQQSQITALLPVISYNAAIETNTLFEEYEQRVNDIYLRYLISPDDTLTQGQLDSLYEIAILCPATEGPAVYQARGLLPYCLKKDIDDDYEGCLPVYPEVMPQVYEDWEDELTTVQGNKHRQQIIPNPNKGSFVLQLTVQSGGMLYIYSADGVLRQEITISEGENRVALKLDLPEGLYYCHIEQGQELPVNHPLLIIK